MEVATVGLPSLPLDCKFDDQSVARTRVRPQHAAHAKAPSAPVLRPSHAKLTVIPTKRLWREKFRRHPLPTLCKNNTTPKK